MVGEVCKLITLCAQPVLRPLLHISVLSVWVLMKQFLVPVPLFTHSASVLVLSRTILVEYLDLTVNYRLQLCFLFHPVESADSVSVEDSGEFGG